MHYLFGPFHLDSIKRTLLRDSERIPLPAKALEMLLVLVESQGAVLKKEELINKVWGVGITVTDNNFNVTLRTVRKALGESGRDPQYILTTSEGYSFIESIRKVDEEFVSDEPAAKGQDAAREAAIASIRAQLNKPFGGYRFHVFSTCFVYASFYSLALLAEIAYQFDRYGSTALKITPLVFCWIFLSSICGMAFNWRWAIQGRDSTLTFTVIIFLIAALLLFVILCLFLPAFPITEANFQTYTAQAAYLKDIWYFLPLVILYLITPFHFIISMQRELRSGNDNLVIGLLTGDKLTTPPKATIYVRTWVLGSILILLAAYFIAARMRLLDNLSPSRYMNLFEQLIQIRLGLYFGLAIQCMAWYYRALTGLKRVAKEMTTEL